MFRKIADKLINRRALTTSARNCLKEGDTVTLVKTITRQDVLVYADLVNDHNPVHLGVDGIVHGTLLLGLVSGLMASSLPGPGTILTGLEVRFSEAVPHPASVEVRVELGRVRRITRAAFSVENKQTGRVVLSGEAGCLLTREQLRSSKH